MHDPTKVLLGTTQSSAKEVQNYNSDPATYKAGLAVRLASTGLLGVAKNSGRLVGISLGKSLSDAKKTSVARDGLKIPILLTDDSDDYAYVIPGTEVYVDDVTGMANIVDDGSVTTTITNAIYASGPLDGIAEDGTTVKVALVDMPGGL